MGIDWRGFANDATHVVNHLARTDYRQEPRRKPCADEHDSVAESMYFYYEQAPARILRPTFMRLQARIDQSSITDSTDFEILVLEALRSSVLKLIERFENTLMKPHAFADLYESMWNDVSDEQFGLIPYEGYLYGPTTLVNDYRYSWWLESVRCRNLIHRPSGRQQSKLYRTGNSPNGGDGEHDQEAESSADNETFEEHRVAWSFITGNGTNQLIYAQLEGRILNARQIASVANRSLSRIKQIMPKFKPFVINQGRGYFRPDAMPPDNRQSEP